MLVVMSELSKFYQIRHIRYNKLRIFEILSCTSFVEWKWSMVVKKIKHKKNFNLLPNLLKLIQFGVIVQNDELHKRLDYFFSCNSH